MILSASPRRIWLALLVTLSALGAAERAAAGVNTWTTSGPCCGDVFLAIDPLTPATLYAGTEKGLFKSTDGGVRWAATALPPDSHVTALAIDPVTPATLYAGAWVNLPDGRYQIVFKTTDGGVSWRVVYRERQDFPLFIMGPNVSVLAIDPTTPTTLFLGILTYDVSSGFSGTLHKSVDGGETWGTLLDLPVTAVVIDPLTPTTVYAAGVHDGVQRSIDGGLSWSAVNTGLPDSVLDNAPGRRPMSLAIDPGAPSILYAGTDQGVFKSTNAGGSWSASSNGMGATPIAALAIDPVTPTTLYAVTTGRAAPPDRVFKSTNGGGSWAAVSVGLGGDPLVSLAIDPVTPTTLYAGSGTIANELGFCCAETMGARGVVKSTDGGATWQLVNAGLPGDPVRTLAIHPASPTTVHAGGTLLGTVRSTDGGASWGDISQSTALGHTVTSLVIHPTTPTTLYAWATDTISFPFGDGVFRKTGAFWERVYPQSDCCQSFGVVAIDPATPSTLYAGIGDILTVVTTGDFSGGVVKSTNGGTSWGPRNTGLPPGTVVRALAIDPVTPTTLYAGTGLAGVFKSTNGAASWAAVNTGLANLSVRAVAIDPTSPATLYAGTDGGLFKSMDGAASWHPAGVELGGVAVLALAIDPVSPTTLYAGTLDRLVFKSTDGGATWHPRGTGLPGAAVHALAIDPATPTTLYAGTGAGVFRLDQASTPARFVTSVGGGAGALALGFTGTAAPTDLSVLVYPPGFLGGVRVALADVDGDGPPELITGPGPGGGPHVRVLRGTDASQVLTEFFAYDPGFTAGLFVAAGDVDGDGRAEIITGAGPGGGPHVTVTTRQPDGTLALLQSFFAYDPGFTGGITVAAGDLDGDGLADVVTGAGPGGGPHVQVFSGLTGALLQSFFAYDTGLTAGIFVAAGDVDGDGVADIVTGVGPGGGPHVQVFSGATGAVLASFFAYDPGARVGMRVATADLDGDGRAEILAAPGAGGGPHVKAFRLHPDGSVTEALGFFAYVPAFLGGVFVAGAP